MAETAFSPVEPEPEGTMAEPELRRRWTRIIPAVFITYSLAYLDRANYGFGAAAGLATTLHISGERSALLASLFFLGYLLPQIPAAIYARRRSARKLIFVSLVAWGSFAALTGVIRNFWFLALDRLLLGAAESVVFPATLILLTRWFTRRERSRANTFLILGNPVTVLWMSAVTGFLIWAIGWQSTFIIEGLLSVAWGFIWLAVIRDSPEQVGWMSERGRVALAHELDREQLTLPPIVRIGAAFRHRNVPRLCVHYFFWSLGVYGFVLWLPVVIRNASAQAIHITGLLVAGPYLVASILMMVVAYYSDRSARRKQYIWPLLMLSGVALGGSFLSVGHSFLWAYGSLIIAGGTMYAPYGPFFAIIPEMLSKHVAGEVMALVNCCGALGGFFGTWLVGFLQAYTGNSRAGFLLMSLSLIVAGIILLGMRPLPQESIEVKHRKTQSLR